MWDCPFSLQIAGFKTNSDVKLYAQCNVLTGFPRCILQKILYVFYLCVIDRAGCGIMDADPLLDLAQENRCKNFV